MLNSFLKLKSIFNFIIIKCIYHNIINIVIFLLLSLFFMTMYNNKTDVVKFIIKIIIYFENLFQFNNYIKILTKPIIFIFIFLLFLHLRSSIPRYKLVDFQNLYWKYLLVYSLIIHIISVLIF